MKLLESQGNSSKQKFDKALKSSKYISANRKHYTKIAANNRKWEILKLHKAQFTWKLKVRFDCKHFQYWQVKVQICLLLIEKIK